jgi:hypothetical protein
MSGLLRASACAAIHCGASDHGLRHRARIRVRERKLVVVMDLARARVVKKSLKILRKTRIKDLK